MDKEGIGGIFGGLLGGLTTATAPMLTAILKSVSSGVLGLATKMLPNLLNTVMDVLGDNIQFIAGAAFQVTMGLLDALLGLFSPLIKIAVDFLEPFTELVNPLLKALLPIVEPIYNALLEILAPITEPMSDWLVTFVERADPSIFDVPKVI